VYNQREIVRYLLSKGRDPNRKDIYSSLVDVPLRYAYQSPDITELLICAGANIFTKTQIYKRSIINLAISHHCEKTVFLLLQHGAEITPTEANTVWVAEFRNDVYRSQRGYFNATTAIMHVLRKRGAPKDMTQWFGKTYMKPHWRGDEWLRDEDGAAVEKKKTKYNA
jgi:hypothetical protein